LLVALALSAAAGSIFALATHKTPSSTLPGLIVSIGSLVFMFFLYYSKLKAAVALKSSTMEKDAQCSLGCIQLSTVLFIGSLIYLISDTVWWIDSAAALGIALFIGSDGYHGIKAALSKDFDGGCCSSEASGPISRALKKRFERSLQVLTSEGVLNPTMFLTKQ